MSYPHNSLEPNGAANPLRAIIGSGPAMAEVYRITKQVAQSQASVLLLGETGTGKELIAHAIHELSTRRERAFVRVNCGALSESLLESELFGHVRGAFTARSTIAPAVSRRPTRARFFSTKSTPPRRTCR